MRLNRREWIASSAALAGFAALPLRAATAERAGVPLGLVHPELRAAVPMIEAVDKGRAPLSRAILPLARKPGANPLFQPPLTGIPYEKRIIPGRAGQPDVVIYVINGRPGASRPAILHTHGGGYFLGDAFSGVRDLQLLCRTLDCVAVTVEYRLAPETGFAGSIEDNYASLKWLYAHAAEVGADPSKIAVMGESAGGGHAALLAIAARDRGEVPVCFQCLVYPMLDDRTGTSRAVAPHIGTLIWTPASNRFGWESFLGVKPGGRTAPKGAVPARLQNLKGLPPAFIGVGTLDLFVDEDVDYAQRLNNAGVTAELIVVPGAFHGFDTIAATAPVSQAFTAAKIAALRGAFA